MIRVTVWNENVEERRADERASQIAAIYPNGIHGVLREIFEECDDLSVTVATMDMPECGLNEALLNETDVLVWWAHIAHEQVPDQIAQRVRKHVLCGMGFIALHSAHPSKPLQLLLGSSGTLLWREGDYCRVWSVKPSHPIAQGVPDHFDLAPEEMYAEPFDIPTPDEIVFMSWFKGGYLFRSGCTWTRGAGKIFYFQPGHETNAAYRNAHVRRILQNAAHWAQPTVQMPALHCAHIERVLEADDPE